jgi:hypothetical protein
MTPNRIDLPSGVTGPEGPADLLDPQLIEALRAAAAALAREHDLTTGSPPGQPGHDTGARKAGKKTAIRAQLWQFAGALLFSAAAATGVIAYLRLTDEYLAIRGEIGKVRRELGLVRIESVRKDEFHSRSLAAHALIREAEATTRATTEIAAQRSEQQQQNLAELRPRLDDVRREAERLRERLSAREKRPGGAKPRATPNGSR